MYRFILFDLDGTLTDPKEGICRSVQYALAKAGITVPDIDVLTPFIGPPLKDSFRQFYHMDEAQTAKAVEDYRVRFSDVGWKENIPYPGIDRLLAHCRQQGARLAVASSKPQVFVERILKYFQLQKYFDVVVGSELDGTRGKKEEVVQEALTQLYQKYGKKMTDAQKREQTVMVGDRKFDVEGARSEHVDAIGVSYGYQEKGELARAGADAIAGSVEELEELLLGGRKTEGGKSIEIRPVPKHSVMKAVYMVAPFAVYFLLYQVVYFFSSYIVGLVMRYASETLKNWIVVHSAGLKAGVQLFNNGGTALALYLFYRHGEPLAWRWQGRSGGSAKCGRYAQTVGMGVMLALGLNVLLNFLAEWLVPLLMTPEEAELFFGKAGYDHSIPLLLGILLFILVTPLLEEIVFRWLLLNRISRVFGGRMAVVITAVFFGFYHGNLLQGTYAFLMGLVMAALCKGEESVSASYLFHVSANAAIFFAAFLPAHVQQYMTAVYLCPVYLLAGVVLYVKMSKSMPNIC
ncbi:MAG: HAD hydrolase-like protein [Lachnospiraceae bacterium]|nr:HAD hydrolase-like protein [Lachnospiraceae bacterium]